MKYLDKYRDQPERAEISPIPYPMQPSKPSKPPFEGFEGSYPLGPREIREHNERAAPDNAQPEPQPPRSHVRAIKIFSEVLGAHLWIVLDPDITDPDPGRYDAPVYSRREVEKLVEAYRRDEVSPDQLRALHAAKKLWPDIRVIDDAEEVENA